MSSQIDHAWVDEYRKNLELLIAQGGSRIKAGPVFDEKKMVPFEFSLDKPYRIKIEPNSKSPHWFRKRK